MVIESLLLKKIENAFDNDDARESHSDQILRPAKHITLKCRKIYAISYFVSETILKIS